MKKLASNQFLKWSNIKERKRKKKLKEMKLKEKKPKKVIVSDQNTMRIIVEVNHGRVPST